VQLEDKNKKIYEKRAHLANGHHNLPGSVKNCRGKLRTFGEQEKQAGEGSTESVGTKKCPGSTQPTRWAQKSARGALRSVGGL